MTTAKKHSAVPVPCKSKLTKSSSKSYRAACANPCAMNDGKTPYNNQIHHILCEHAIAVIEPADDPSGEKLSLINDCLCMITWDINEAVNLIGLPMKSAYVNSGGRIPKSSCCHNVDHGSADGYTQECIDYLHAQIWDTIVDKKKSHQVNAKNILQALKDCTTEFTTRLTNRGLRDGSDTQVSYVNRLTRPKWYHPFSMAKKPTKRSPGGSRMPRILKMIR